jgi:hypothetical protein
MKRLKDFLGDYLLLFLELKFYFLKGRSIEENPSSYCISATDIKAVSASLNLLKACCLPTSSLLFNSSE